MQGWSCLAIVGVGGAYLLLSLLRIDVPFVLAGFLVLALPYVFATRLLWRAKRPLNAGKGWKVTGREKKELLAIGLIVILASIAVQLLAPRLMEGW